MTDDDEFRRQAADAEKQALSARSDYDREAWLRISQGFEPATQEAAERCGDGRV